MEPVFNNIVEAAYSLPMSSKIELKNLLEHNIAEERRDEIVANYKVAKDEHKNNKLKFSSSINELKKMT